MKKYFLFLFACLIFEHAHSQSVEILTQKDNISFRGLSVVSDRVLWVSGTQGTVGKSEDGGKTWNWMQVKGFEHADFRDVEAFDKKKAIVMGIASPAFILRTDDGGANWKVVYENKDSLMFLDAMEFWNDQSGIVIGDPIDGRFFIGRTFDGGQTWRGIPESYRPKAEKGEACFAASGTNIIAFDRDEAVFVTGGLVSRFFVRDQVITLPLLQGEESTGANSVAKGRKNTLIVVGGNFLHKDDTTLNCAISKDGGHSWMHPAAGPSGYRSCVEHIKKKKWITCGLNGVDMSLNDGNTWQSISKESFHVCRRAKKGKTVYLAGNDGKIGVLQMK